MKMLRRLRQGSLALVLGLLVAACNDPGDASNGQGDWTTVNITVGSVDGDGARPLATGVLGAEIGSAYIMVVPAGTPVSPYPWLMPAPITAGMLNPATSTVMLTVPTGLSMQLVEYLYNDVQTPESVFTRVAIPGGPDVSPAFSVASGATSLSVALPIATKAFNETLAAPTLDPLLWNSGNEGLVDRRIVNFAGSLAFQAAASGRDVVYRARLRPTTLVVNPSLVNQVETDATVTAVSGSGAVARVAGHFYHTPTSGEVAGDATGDIHAVLQLNGATATYFVGKCLSDACTGGSFQFISGPTVLTTVLPNVTVHLSVQWNGSLFSFAVTGGATGSATFNPVAAGFPVAGAPNSTFKEVGIRLNPGVGVGGAMTAVFDNVAFNGTLYDDFEAASGIIDTRKWTEGTAGSSIVTSVGGVKALRLTAAATPSGDATIDSNGVSGQLRVNPHQRLNSHRLSGTMLIPSAEPPSLNDIGTLSANQRIIGRLNYQPRAWRNGGQTQLSGVDVGIYKNSNNAPTANLSAFACADEACVTPPGNITGGGTFSTPLYFDTAYPFSVELLSGKRVRGIFNGEARVADLGTVPFFDPSDLVSTLLRAQTRRTIDAGDFGTISADFSNIQVGLPAAPIYPSNLSPLVKSYDTFDSSLLSTANWRDARQFKRAIVNRQLRIDTVSQPDPSNNGSNASMDIRVGPTTRGLDVLVVFPSSFTYPDTMATQVYVNGGVGGQFYSSGTSKVEASINVNQDGLGGWFVGTCTNNGPCTQLAMGPLATLALPDVGTRLAVIWNGASGFTFMQDGITVGTYDASATAPNTGALPTGPRIGVQSGSYRQDSMNTNVYNVFVLFDDATVWADTGSGPAAGATDAFDASLIDQTFWSGGEAQQLLAFDANTGNGSIVMSDNSSGVNSSNPSLEFPNGQLPPAVSAQVTLTDATGNGRLFLYHSAYSDGTNDIYGLFSITGTQVLATIISCPGGDCPPLNVLKTVPIGTVTVGSTHRLFMQWDGGWFTFQLDSDPPVVIDPKPLAANLGPAIQPNGGFNVGNFSETLPGYIGGVGTVTAILDNVRAGGALPVRLP